MLYYAVYDMTTGTGAKYLGTVKASDRIDAQKQVTDLLGLTEDQIMLQVTIEQWYNENPEHWHSQKN